MSNFKSALQHITTFIFDYDGVLTDGSILMTENGDALRIASIKDGYALQLAVKNGYRVAIISGAKSSSMSHRLQALKITDIMMGIENKLLEFEAYLQTHDIQPSQVLFMGDDIPDLEIMRVAGLPTCPSDAVEEIKNEAVYISDKPGGKGCVRDVIEQVMKVQGKWMNHQALYW